MSIVDSTSGLWLAPTPDHEHFQWVAASHYLQSEQPHGRDLVRPYYPCTNDLPMTYGTSQTVTSGRSPIRSDGDTLHLALAHVIRDRTTDDTSIVPKGQGIILPAHTTLENRLSHVLLQEGQNRIAFFLGKTFYAAHPRGIEVDHLLLGFGMSAYYLSIRIRQTSRSSRFGRFTRYHRP